MGVLRNVDVLSFFVLDYYGMRSGSSPDVISIPSYRKKFFDVLEENSLV